MEYELTKTEVKQFLEIIYRERAVLKFVSVFREVPAGMCDIILDLLIQKQVDVERRRSVWSQQLDKRLNLPVETRFMVDMFAGKVKLEEAK
jgi:hypothetical protein